MHQRKTNRRLLASTAIFISCGLAVALLNLSPRSGLLTADALPPGPLSSMDLNAAAGITVVNNAPAVIHQAPGAGQTSLAYSLTLQNPDNLTLAPGARITGTLPVGSAALSCTSGITWSAVCTAGHTVTYSLISTATASLLDVGAYTVSVSVPVQDGTLVVNDGGCFSGTVDGTPRSFCEPHPVTTTIRAPDISLTERVSPTVRAGERVTYALTITNPGSVRTTRPFTIVGQIDPTLEVLTSAISPPGNLVSHTITWTLDATLQPYGGSSATCTWAANVSSTLNRSLTNTYTFTSPEVLPHRSVWRFPSGTSTDVEADFTTSYKSAPPIASTDDVVTYTIVAMNSGGDAQDVVLSDNPPRTTVFIPGSCTYRRGVSPTQACGPLDQMWQEDFASGDRITTTFAVRMTAGSMNWPLINCATLSWGDNQERLCAETVINPHFAIYLPLTMRNYVPFCAPQLVTEIRTGPQPHGVAVDTAGHRAFVAHAEGVTVIDTDSHTVITETGTPAGAYNVAYDPDQNRIWIARRDADRVAVLDGATYTPLAELPAGAGPLDVAYNAANERIYVSSFLGNRVNVYNAVDMKRERTLGDFQEPGQIAINPITNKIYVVNHVNNAQMTVIDGETHETYRMATGLLDGYGVAVDPNRNLIYVTSIYEGRLVIIDGETEEGLGKIEFRRSDGRKPPLRFLAVNPDVGTEGHLFLLTSSADKGEDQLLLIPNGWPTLGTPIPLDIARYPLEGIAFDPDTDRVWVTSVESGIVSVIQDGLPVCSYPF